MKTMTVLAAVVLAALGTGCASTGTTPAGQAGQSELPQWEHHRLADGVEIAISDDASPEARRLAEELQSEMRSRYLNARQ